MSKITIFCYLRSPRVYKSTIAGRYAGTEVEYIGDSPKNLPNWLWDDNPRELTSKEKETNLHLLREPKIGFSEKLYKTDKFIEKQPFGTVPAAFAGSKQIGLFESNSIMRAVARLGNKAHGLLGADPIEESLIDGFLDKLLVFAVYTQRYLLAVRSGPFEDSYEDMDKHFSIFLQGIEQALSTTGKGGFIVGDCLTLADISFACELCLFTNELKMDYLVKAGSKNPLFPQISQYPKTLRHLEYLLNEPHFARDLSYFHSHLVSHNIL